MRKSIWLWALLLLSALPALAVPAYPDLVAFTQPHSKEQFNILLKGDERVHWAETEDGYSLLHVKDGTLYYAMRDADGDMVPSTYPATAKEHRSLAVLSFLASTPQHLRFSRKQIDGMVKIWQDLSAMKHPAKEMGDVLGNKRFLVVLFAFSDQAFTHTAAEFANLFNQVNYTANGSTGSVHDYYYRVSQGLFSLQVDVVGPFTGSQTTAHYGNGGTSGTQDFASEAVDSAARYVDFRDYDNDGDGTIDGLHIIFAGHGEEATGNDDEIWSHKWNIFSAPVYDSTVVNVYSCSPECSGNQGNTITNVGVICHELGHVFGSPDYYDTDYGESDGQYPGLGKWDIMSGGSWNRNGSSPAQHNPYTKIYIYHWATCDTLDSPQQVVMQSSDKVHTDFHRINTSTEGDFFLIENRQQNDWDIAIPGHGLLVYHVHPDAQGAWVSNAGHPQQLYIMAATYDTFPTAMASSYGDLNDASAPLPGTANRTELTDYSVPALRPWSHALNGTPLTYISENASTGKVFLCFQGAEPALQHFEATGESDIDVKARWDGYGSMNVLLLSNTADLFSTPTASLRAGDTLPQGDIVAYRGNAAGMDLTGLQSNTTYYYRLYLLLSDSTLSTLFLSDTAATRHCSATPWRQLSFNDSQDIRLDDCWIGDGWTVNAADGTLRNRNMALDTQDYGDTNRLVLPPFSCDSNRQQQHIALSFTMKSAGITAADSNIQLQVLLKNSIDSAWHPVLRDSSLAGNGWQRVYVQLYNCTRYTQVAFRLICADQPLRQQGVVYVDSITLTPGCLLHSYVGTEGGDMSVEGYRVFPQDTTVRVVLHRHPGYEFNRLYLDGTRKFPAFDTLFSVTMNRQHVLYATFRRNTAISETNAETFSAYPNPATNRLYVTLPAASQAGSSVVLYDMSGRPVMRQAATGGKVVLNLTALAPGAYFLRAGSYVRKIVKK